MYFALLSFMCLITCHSVNMNTSTSEWHPNFFSMIKKSLVSFSNTLSTSLQLKLFHLEHTFVGTPEHQGAWLLSTEYRGVAGLTEVNEEASITLALVLGHCHDAWHVVLESWKLLFAEISHQVTAFLIIAGQNIEKKRLHIIVKGLVVQKQLS